MNTCKTCRHWIAVDRTSSEDMYADTMCHPYDIDLGGPMVLPYELRRCRHPSLTFCETPPESNGFGITDASQYYAALVTAEDFGCVRHEPLP